ncbi:MAG: MFS transporter [Defluviitaleaceae bacterium]|nr:MFS transporter [Defluviitaleaceae bacterium]
MSRLRLFIIANKAVTGLLSALFNGICTAYLISKGFDLFAISKYFSLSLIISPLLRIPLGYLADRVGRKKVYSCGLLLRAMQGFILIAGQSMFSLYMAAIAEAAYSALISGSLEAWLKGTVQQHGISINYPRLFGISKFVGSLVSIVTIFSIGFFLDIQLEGIIRVISIIYLSVSMCNLLIYKDQKGESETIAIDIRRIISAVAKNKKVHYLCFILTTGFILISVYMLYFQAKALEIGVLESSLLILASIGALGSGISAFVYSKIGKKVNVRQIMPLLFIGVLASFIIMNFSHNIVMLGVGNFMYGISMGPLMPIFYSWALDSISNDYTSTLISFMTAVATVAAAVATIVIGYLINNMGLTYAIYSGIVLGAISITFLLYMNKVIKTQK